VPYLCHPSAFCGVASVRLSPSTNENGGIASAAAIAKRLGALPFSPFPRSGPEGAQPWKPKHTAGVSIRQVSIHTPRVKRESSS
jgi:hypothetical protein